MWSAVLKHVSSEASAQLLLQHLDADIAARTSSLTPAEYVRDALRNSHPRLDHATKQSFVKSTQKEEEKKKE